MNTIEQLRQVQAALDAAMLYPEISVAYRMCKEALAIMPSIIASVEEMGKPGDEAIAGDANDLEDLIRDTHDYADGVSGNSWGVMASRMQEILGRFLALRPYLRPSERESLYRWQPIETVPKDTSKGDFLIANYNTSGDALWIKVVRNPNNHYGITIATHWMPLAAPPSTTRIEGETP